MATMTVWKFNDPEGAGEALGTVRDLAKEHLLNLNDGAVVTWAEGAKKPKTKQLADLTGVGALSGAFWGLLFGLIFFVPFLGLAVGAAMGALAGHFSSYGIDQDFIDEVREKVTEGTSALFLLTSDATIDKVVEAFDGQHMELIKSSLSHEQENALREAFGEDD
ncbi:MAG: DUF1269 domain-containing protein [Miltoncostaeaceae bacterium]